jgi:hypothetical protein
VDLHLQREIVIVVAILSADMNCGCEPDLENTGGDQTRNVMMLQLRTYVVRIESANSSLFTMKLSVPMLIISAYEARNAVE